MVFLSISCISIFFSSLFSSVFVLFNRPVGKTKIVWSLFSFSVALWAFGYGLMVNSQSQQTAYLWSLAHNYIAIFIPILFFHFTCLITQIRVGPFVFFSYFVFFILFVFSLLSPNLFLTLPVEKPPFKYYDNAQILFLIYFVLYCIYANLGVYNLIKVLFSKDFRLRAQIRLVFLGVSIGFAGGVTAFPYVFNIYIYPYGIILINIYVLTTAYAITKHNLMNISVVIKRGSAYAITGMVAAATFLWTGYLLYDSPRWIIQGFLAIGLFWTFFGLRFKDFLITTARRVFIKNYYNPQLSLLQVTTALNTTIERDQIFIALGLALDEILQPAEVIVCIRQGEGEITRQFLRTPENERHSTTLSPWEPATSDWFLPIEKLKEPVFMAELSSSDQKEILAELPKSYRKQAVLMPLTLSNGESEGFVILAEKDSGQGYIASDLDFLKTVQHIGNGTLDKIRPYEEIRAEYNLILRHETQLETALKMIVTLNHEINNPLTAIYMSAQVLETMLPNENIQERHLVDVITIEINRVMGLMRQLEKTDRFCETEYISGVSMMKVTDQSD